MGNLLVAPHEDCDQDVQDDDSARVCYENWQDERIVEPVAVALLAAPALKVHFPLRIASGLNLEEQ